MHEPPGGLLNWKIARLAGSLNDCFMSICLKRSILSSTELLGQTNLSLFTAYSKAYK
jgi:hypothetical protein